MKVTDLGKYFDSKLNKVKKAHTDALFESVDYIVLWSPVDTGNFRANWQGALGGDLPVDEVQWWGNDYEMNRQVTAGVPSYGYSFAMTNIGRLIEMSAGEQFDLVNTTDYGGDLESGYSPQSKAFTAMGFDKYKQLLEAGLKKNK